MTNRMGEKKTKVSTALNDRLGKVQIWLSLSLWNYGQGKGVGEEMEQLPSKLRGSDLNKSSIRAKEKEPKFKALLVAAYTACVSQTPSGFNSGLHHGASL